MQLHAVGFMAHDPDALARFWGGLLGWERADEAGVPTLLPDADAGFRLRFHATTVPKWGPNQFHPELTSVSPADQQATVARALELGARHHDVGQGPEDEHVVLADPEDNELCVIEPGNRFLAGCGRFASLSGDGLREVGCFWAAALDWPLVWDQDEETAVQAPWGGPKITWGGPPVRPKLGPNRIRLELAVGAGEEREAESARLVGLGATRLDGVLLADPGGNELVLT